MRGFAVIALDRPKTPANLGGVLRAAGAFGADMVVVGGHRMGKFATDTAQAWRHVPCVEADDIMSLLPFGCIPVVVEIHPKARPLQNFIHPERGYYVFGPEDGSVSKRIVESAAHIIKIESANCLNLAAAVNVVLYDRNSKMRRSE